MNKNYKQAAEMAKDMIFQFCIERMEDKNITYKELSGILQISTDDLKQYLNNKKEMPFGLFLQMLGALELRPYLIPAEEDNNTMQRMFFN